VADGDEQAPELKDDPEGHLLIRIESFKDCWAEGSLLARAEVKEVEPNGRNFEPDVNSILTNEMLGTFRILVARLDGRMIGYLSWMVDFDIESYGTLIANQTAWYVEPGHYGVADKMFRWVVDEFKRIGVKYAYFHHTLNGRGRDIGKYLERKGARLSSLNYVMKL
jgi:hypothetical protein